jgi:hypothetical protein
MTWTSMIPILLLLAAVVIATQIAGKGKGIGRLPVEPRALMTDMERRTIGYIEAVIPTARVHAQVSMGALMRPKSGLDKSTRQRTLNRFTSRRVDFVVEDRASGRIMLLIELDDRSHNAAKDRDRDKLTGRAGYTTVRLPASERPTAESVRRHVGNALGIDTGHQQPALA